MAGMRDDDEIPLVGSWWRLGPGGTPLDGFGDAMAYGIAPFGRLELWRYGVWLPEVFVCCSGLFVGATARALLTAAGCRVARVQRMFVTEPEVDWLAWRNDWERRLETLLARLDTRDPDDLVRPESPRAGITVVESPAVWQVIGDDRASIDDLEEAAVWDPVFDNGRALLVRDRIQRLLTQLDATPLGPLLEFEWFRLPVGWRGVRRKPGGWRRPAD